MRVALTGASGFVGRHVLSALLDCGADIVAVTRDESRLSHLRDRITIAVMDLMRPAHDCFARMGNPDVLIHLAWNGLSNYQSLHHFETELPFHYGFLKSMVTAGLRSVVVAGTCLEYGMQSGALGENHPTCPTTAYGYAKDALRRQLEFLKTVKPFELIWVRLFYVYGEGQPAHTIYRQIQDAAARGDRKFRMSGGEQLRDYLPAADAGRALAELAMFIEHSPDVVNVCSGHPVSMRRRVEEWIKALGAEIVPETGHYPYPEYEPMAFWGDRRRLDLFYETLRGC
jgi:nucleoside-diphosphate-sugar epimerase